MTLFRLQFAGQIKKAERRQVGPQTVVELSVCKKIKGKTDAEDSFTWVRVSLWKPADFQIDRLKAGAFIAGSGEFSLRSYVDKNGAKAVSADVRCSSFDIEIGDSTPIRVGAVSSPPSAVRYPPRTPDPTPPPQSDDEPPF